MPKTKIKSHNNVELKKIKVNMKHCKFYPLQDGFEFWIKDKMKQYYEHTENKIKNSNLDKTTKNNKLKELRERNKRHQADILLLLNGSIRHPPKWLSKFYGKNVKLPTVEMTTTKRRFNFRYNTC